jgi:hypothetical protein
MQQCRMLFMWRVGSARITVFGLTRDAVLLAGKLQIPDAETWTAISLTRLRETRFVPETKSTNCRPTRAHWRELVLGSVGMYKLIERADALKGSGYKESRARAQQIASAVTV